MTRTKSLKQAKKCQICKTPFRARKDAKTCSPACRKRLERHIRSQARQKANRLESELGREFHRLAAQLLPQHVHFPLNLDERGAVEVPTLPSRDTQTEINPAPEGLETLQPESLELPATAPARSPADQTINATSSSVNQVIVADQSNSALQPGLQNEIEPAAPRQRFKLFGFNRTALTATLVVLLVVIGLGAGGLVLLSNHKNGQQLSESKSQPNTTYPVSTLKLGALNPAQLSLGGSNKVYVNGQLNVSSGLVLEPSSAPTGATAGQFYYDQTTNKAYYYNGSKFVSLEPTPQTLPPSYISSLGSLVGLTANGNGGQGSQPGLSINYGSTANTAVQGNVSLTCSSGSGNLTGGGNTITLGSGGTCASLSVVSNPTFASFNLSNNFNSNLGTITASAPSGSGNASFILPSIPGGSSDTICLQGLANCSGGGGAAGGDLTGTYPNPTIAKLQGTTLTISALNNGDVLQYNGSAFVNGPIAGVAYLSQNQTFTGHNTFETASNSTTGFSVQNNVAGTVFDVDTINSRIGIGTAGPGYALDVQGGDINTSGIYRVGGTQISSSSLSNDSDLAKLSGNQLFTGNNNFSGAVTIQGNNDFTLGTVASAGSIIFHDGASNNTGTLQLAGTLISNATYNLPVAAGAQTICTLQLANCATAGNTISGTGNANSVAKFTGAHTIGNSNISDDGTTVTISSGTAIQGAAGLTLGNSGVTGSLVFKNANNSNTISIQSGISTGNFTLTLPPSDGSNGDCLKTNGFGSLSFATCTGGAGGGVTSINTLTGVLSLLGTANQISVASSGNTITLSLPQNISTTSDLTVHTITLNGQGTTDNLITANAVAGSTGTLLNLQVNGTSEASIDSGGNLSIQGLYEVNGTQISSANLSNDANLAKLNGTGPQTFTGNNEFTGTVLVQPASDSTHAVQISNHAGSSTVFNADTTNSRVGIDTATPNYPLDVNGDINTTGVYRINGNTVCSGTTCNAAAGNTNYIQNGTSIQSSANFAIQSTAAGSIGGVIRGASSQMADLLELQNSGAGILDKFDNTGALTTAGGLTVQSGGASITGDLTFQQATTISNVAANVGTELLVKAGDSLLGTGGNLVLQAGAGVGVSGSVLVQSNGTNSTTAFAVQNAATASILGVDTVNNKVSLGSDGTIAGLLAFNTTTAGNPITLKVTSNSTSGGYVLSLPTSAPSPGLCLEAASNYTSSNGNLTFSSCSNASANISFVGEHDAQGSGSPATGITSLPLSNVGDLVVVTVQTGSTTAGSVSVTGVSDSGSKLGNCSRVGNDLDTDGTVYGLSMWQCSVIATGTTNLTISTSGTLGNSDEITASEYTASGINAGSSWSALTSSATDTNADGSKNFNYPSLTAQANGELYFGYAQVQDTPAAAGSTSGFTYRLSGQNNLLTYNTNLSGGSTSMPNGKTNVASDEAATTAAIFVANVGSTYINNSTTSQQGNFNITSASSFSVGGVISGASGQTANLLNFTNSSGFILSEFSKNGYLQGGDLTGNSLTTPNQQGNPLVLAGGQGSGFGNGGDIQLLVAPPPVNTPTQLTTFNNINQPEGIAFDSAGYVYYGWGNRIGRAKVNLSSGSVTNQNDSWSTTSTGSGGAGLSTCGSAIPGVATVNSGNFTWLYWTCTGGSPVIGTIEINETTGAVVPGTGTNSLLSLSCVFGIAATSSNLYYSCPSGNTIGRAVLNPSNPGAVTSHNDSFISNATSPELLAINTTNVFFGENNTQVGKADIVNGTSSPTNNCITGVSGATRGVALNGTSLYASSRTSAQISIASTSCGAASTFAAGPYATGGIAIFGSSLIWDDTGTNKLWAEGLGGTTWNQLGSAALDISGQNGAASFVNNVDSTSAFVIQNAAKTTTLFDADTSNGRIGINTATPGNTLSVNAITTADSLAQVAIGTNATTNKGLVVQGVATQSADLVQLQDSTGIVGSKFNSTGNQLTLGTVASSGTVYQGKLVLADGTTDNFASTLNTATLTANRTISLPNAGGTLCLQSTTACGFILNQSSQQSSSNFNIDGSGTIGTNLNVSPTTGTGLIVTGGPSGNVTFIGSNGIPSSYTYMNSSGQWNFGASTSQTSYNVQINGTANITSTLQVGLGSAGATALCYNGSNQIASCSGGAGAANYILNQTTTQTAANFNIQSASLSSVGGIIQGAASQSADLLRFEDSNSIVGGKFNSTGNQLTLGTVASSGTVYKGALLLADGTADNFSSTVNTNTLTASQTISLPDDTVSRTDSFCLVTLANCSGSNGGGGNTNYIFNQSSLQASSNFHISGTGTADTSLVTPLLDTASAVTLNIGATSSGINLNQSATVAANKNLTLNSGTGTYSQTYVSSGTGTFSAHTVNATNSNATGTATTVNAQTIGLTGTASGTNTINGVNFSNVTAIGGNTFNALNVGTGYTNLLQSANVTITAAGAVTAGTYNTTTLTGSALTFGTAGTATIQPAASQALTITGHAASTWSTDSGALTLTSAAAATWSTSAGALTVQSAAALNLGSSGGTKAIIDTSGNLQFQQASTVSTSTGNLTLQANGTSTLALDTSGAGTVSVGSTNATTINIGSNDVTHAIHIGDGGSSNVQTVTIGSTNGTSPTTVKSGTSGIALNPAGGSTNNGVLIKPGTNTSNAFLVQNAAGTGTLFQVDTTNNNITIGGNNSGELQTWQTATNGIGSVVALPEWATGATANGYAYYLGGNNGLSASSATYYSKLNSDGSTGTWTSTTALPASVENGTTVVYNGYIYDIAAGTVYYAKLNSSGTIGTWNTSGNTVPVTVSYATSVVANGYVYVIGGFSGTAQTAVYYAKLNSDGSIGAWSTASHALPAVRWWASSVVANGYLYEIGGQITNGTNQSTVYYAQLNSDGSLGTWSTASNALPVASSEATSVVADGYVYEIGGGGTGGSAVYYAKLNNDGSVGTWSTAANALPGTRASAVSFVQNGYVYEIGGTQGTALYASTPRLQVGASLDLLGLQGQDLADPGSQGLGSTGGSITAGNANFVGDLQVQGQAQFAQNVNVNGSLNVASSATIIQGGTNVASIGSEKMISTTDFSSNWSGANWSNTNGATAHSTGATTADTYSGFTPVANTEYQVTFIFSGASGNGTDTILPNIGGVNGSVIYSASGTETQVITTSGTGSLKFTPTTNWAGTITSVSVKVITTDSSALTVQDSSGVSSLEVRTSNSQNTFLGVSAGQSNTSGVCNVGVGNSVLASDTTGQCNTAVGYQAMQFDTTGSNNSAFGEIALQKNSTGGNNTGIGLWALTNNTTGSNNTALGELALANSRSASGNVGIGTSALNGVTVGGNNVGVGFLSGITGTSANQNVSGTNNTYLGYEAGPGSSTQFNNATAVGTYAVVSQSDALVLGCVSGTNGCTTTTSVGIGTATPSALLSVGASSAFQVTNAGVVTATYAAATAAHGVCKSGSGTASSTLQACTGSVGADFAEMYPTESTVGQGDIVAPNGNYVTSQDGNYQLPILRDTQGVYDSGVMGVISQQTLAANGDEGTIVGNNVKNSDNGQALALNGRVLTKVDTENGPIEPGDWITASSTPGVGMKATQAGEVVGRALQAYNGSGVAQVLVFINPSYYNPTDGSQMQGGDLTNLNVSGLATINNLQVNGTATFDGIAVFNSTINVNGHIVTGNSSGNTTATIQAGAGTGATCSVNGNDTAGQITLITGAGSWASGAQCVINFSSSFGSAPHPVMTLASGTDDDAVRKYLTSTAGSFTINFINADTAQHTFTWNYFNAQ